jgi:lipopolysaccharide export system protein LptA
MNLDARGEPNRGLTSATFAGTNAPACVDPRSAPPECDVDYREQDARATRRAKALSLTVVLKPGMSSLEEATFSRNVRFYEGVLGSLAAHAKYVLDTGSLELSGSEPARPRPHIENEQIIIDATHIDVTLVGPKMKASGAVSSVLKPSKANDPASSTKMPSMLKSDQVVYIAAEGLDYDGELSKATYTGRAKLWQAETSVQAQTLTLDNKSGDLTASEKVTTSTMLEQLDSAKKKKERVRSVGTSANFNYEEATRRATYTGDAHLAGPQGDMTADKIELYLKPSGDELDRVEGYDKLTLREQTRKTTGVRMTYTTANETYVVTGLPVAIVDECGRETKGRKLTFVKSTDTVVVDGGGQVRTQTQQSAGKCQ